MKTINRTQILWLITGCALICGQIIRLSAQDTNIDWGTASDDQVILQAIELTSPIPSNDVPDFATFYSAQHSPISSSPWPPLPGNMKDFNAWDLGSNIWVLDDLGFDYNAPSSHSMIAMDAGGLFPGGDGGTNDDEPDFGGITPIDYGTNLWISQEAVSGGNFTGILSNTIPGVQYQLLAMNSLNCTQWVYEGTPILANTNWAPWSLPFDPTTNFFLNALSLQDDGSGLPDWWQMKYFGSLGINPDAQDSAGDGWSNWQKYEMGINPSAWATPQVPPDASAFYNSQNQTVTLTWQPSLGNVTGYTVTRIVPPSDIEQLASLSATATNFIDTAPVTHFAPEVGAPYYYLQATYAEGNSLNAVLPMFEPNTAVSAQIVTASSGANLTLTSPLPTGTTALQLLRIDYDYSPYFGYEESSFNIPANEISGNTALLSEDDFSDYEDGDYYEEDWYVQTVNTNGGVSTPAQASSNIAPLFFDGRQQLAQNVNFLLREANTQFGWSAYAFSGLYDEVTTYSGESTGPYLDKFEPFEENYFYKNLVYSPTNVDGNGFLTTGLQQNLGFAYIGYALVPPLTYTFQPETTNNVIPAVLDPTETPFITFYPDTESDYQILYDQIVGYENGPDQYLGLSGGGNAWAFSSPATNWYGLPITSVLFGYNQNGTYETSVLSLGDSNTNINGGGLYWQVASPELQTIGYYFAQPWAEPLPGDLNFSVTNVTSTGLVAGFGQTSVFAGYAEQTLLNGIVNPNAPYAYLGQYFEPEAYQVDSSGNVTTTNAGTVSPYGEFVASEPGPVALVTMPNYGENVQGTGIVQVVKLVLDANHDGTMDLSANGPDNTTASTPYVFWANNNYDRFILDNDDGVDYDDDTTPSGDYFTPNVAVPDCNFLDGDGHRVIPCARDLQDFARLWIAGMTTNLLAALPAGCTVSLNWGDTTYPNPANPTIDLFAAYESDGGLGYLTNNDISEFQTLSPYIGRLGPGSNLVLNASTFANNWAGNYFIWCGVSNGTGGLNLTIANSNGTVLAQTTAYIKIEDIKQMYERFTVGDQPAIAPTTNVALSTEGLVAGETAFEYPPPEDTNSTYILFVHGWNMEPYDKDRFAESAYKRLYWQGYQGRFGQFRWPTTYGFTGNFWQALTDPRSYDNGEYQAWQSAQGLMNLLFGLNGEYPGHVYVLAHSMGNVVTGEALRLAAVQGLGQIVNTYVASQAAIPAHGYDSSVTTPYLLPFTYTYPTYPLEALGSRNYGPDTPNIYVNRFTNNTVAVGRRISLYNENDFALAIPRWGFDQITKPDYIPPNSYYYYNGSLSDPAPWNDFYISPIVGDTGVLADIVTNMDNLYQVMSYAAESRSTALGATPIITFDQVLNLTTVWPADPTGNNFTEHFYHSAEFRGDAWQQWNYWNTLLYSPQFGFNINSQ